MPSYVVKCDPNRDEYVYWSDIVEAPHLIGTRSEVRAYLARIGEAGEDPAARFERADRTGTSALPGFYDWSDEGFIVEQRGFLPRSRLADFARQQMADDQARYDLLEPFDDDDPPASNPEDSHDRVK